MSYQIMLEHLKKTLIKYVISKHVDDKWWEVTEEGITWGASRYSKAGITKAVLKVCLDSSDKYFKKSW